MIRHVYAEMIAAHLNAPYGPLVTASDVVAVLSQGATSLVGKDPAAAFALGSIFDECRPSLVLKACAEIGLDHSAALTAYSSLVSAGANRVSEWDELAARS